MKCRKKYYVGYSNVLMIPRENIFRNSENVFPDFYFFVFYEKFWKVIGKKLRDSKKIRQGTSSYSCFDVSKFVELPRVFEKIPTNSNKISDKLWETFPPHWYTKNVSKVVFGWVGQRSDDSAANIRIQHMGNSRPFRPGCDPHYFFLFFIQVCYGWPQKWLTSILFFSKYFFFNFISKCNFARAIARIRIRPFQLKSEEKYNFVQLYTRWKSVTFLPCSIRDTFLLISIEKAVFVCVWQRVRNDYFQSIDEKNLDKKKRKNKFW